MKVKQEIYDRYAILHKESGKFFNQGYFEDNLMNVSLYMNAEKLEKYRVKLLKDPDDYKVVKVKVTFEVTEDLIGE